MLHKNLLYSETANEVIERVQKLQPGTKPLWGRMTVTEMLVHCNEVHERILAPATPTGRKTSLKQYLLRWIVLYIMKHYPKNAKAPKQVQVQRGISESEFEEQKQKFIRLVRGFSINTKPIIHHHPYFGSLSTKEWGLASYKHVDHHLRQFGV